MNLNENATRLLENDPIFSRSLPEEAQSRVRVEPCEFERLLLRAMEILGIRAQIEAASRS